MIQSTNQLITSQQKFKLIVDLTIKNSKTIANILEVKLVEADVDRARYHCGALEGTSIIRLFQNVNNIFY